MPAPVSTPATRSAGLGVQLERRRLLSLWLAVAATLAWVPGGFSRFVFAKLLVLAVACLVAAAVPPQGRLTRPLVGVVLVGLAVLVLAALVGRSPVASLVGRWPRYEGLPVLGMYVAAAWLGARVVGRGPVRLHHLAHALAAISVVLGGLSLLEVLGASPLGDSGVDRSGSALGNATDQGLVAMMAAIVVASAARSRRDPLLLAGLAAAVATVGMSGSRTAMIVSLLAATAFVWRDRRALLLPALGLVAAMSVVALIVPSTRERILDGATASSRVTQWRLTLDLVVDHPWLGTGPSGYVDAFGRYESLDFVRFTGDGVLADSPHQVLLQAVVAGGLPLLFCFLVAVGVLARRTREVLGAHPEAWGLAVAVTAYGVALMVNFTSPGPTCLAALLTGALVADPPVGTERPVVRVARTTVLAVAAVVLLMSCVAEILLQHGVTAASEGRRGAAYAGVVAAQRWRPVDSDVAMLGSKAIAGLVSSGDLRSAARARALAEESLERTPDSYDAQVALGVALMAQEEYAAAEAPLDRAVVAFPDRTPAYVQRALARLGQADPSGALDDLRTAQRLAPRSRTVARLIDEVSSLL